MIIGNYIFIQFMKMLSKSAKALVVFQLHIIGWNNIFRKLYNYKSLQS